MAVEYYDAETELDYVSAMQRRINDGSIWRLEGSAGRAAMELIESGACALGPNDCHDYWGNHVPSRSQVQEGTKGSVGFVHDHGNEVQE